MSQTSDKIVARLNGAHAGDEDDDRDRFKNGIRKTWSVDINEVTANVQVDKVDADTNIHIEKFSVEGKWSSHVRKDNFALKVLIDKVWGDDKRPYGNFTIRVKAIDGGITSDVIVNVDGFQDEPNQYARGHAEDLVRGILSHIRDN